MIMFCIIDLYSGLHQQEKKQGVGESAQLMAVTVMHYDGLSSLDPWSKGLQEIYHNWTTECNTREGDLLQVLKNLSLNNIRII